MHRQGGMGWAHVSVATCFVCHASSYWLAASATQGSMIYPTTQRSGPVHSPDMPEAVAALYEEAAAVANLSPRSASALLRLALEALLEELYPDVANLNDMIGAAVRDGLPKQVQQTMDVLRFNGNRSVHEIHHDDTPETTATLFNLLNIVVERLVTQPKQLDELYDGLPDGVREQIERRDATT